MWRISSFEHSGKGICFSYSHPNQCKGCADQSEKWVGTLQFCPLDWRGVPEQFSTYGDHGSFTRATKARWKKRTRWTSWLGNKGWVLTPTVINMVSSWLLSVSIDCMKGSLPDKLNMRKCLDFYLLYNPFKAFRLSVRAKKTCAVNKQWNLLY